MLAASFSFMPLPRTIMPISRCAVVLYSSTHQNQPVLTAPRTSHHCISHSLVNHDHPCLLMLGSAATYVSYPRLIGSRLSPIQTPVFWPCTRHPHAELLHSAIPRLPNVGPLFWQSKSPPRGYAGEANFRGFVHCGPQILSSLPSQHTS